MTTRSCADAASRSTVAPPTALIDRVDVDRIGFDAITADDGRIALMTYGEDGQSLLLFDATGRSLGALEGGGDRLQRDAEVAAR